MTRTMLRWAGTVVLAGTLLLAGGHFVYYLYHWEWVRAQIAGIALTAALVVAATRIVLARVDRAERNVLRRLDALEAAQRPRQAATAKALTSVQDGNGSHGGHFPWLTSEFSPPRHRAMLPLALLAPLATTMESPQPAVFIPVLLGAGLAVSAVAGLVERTAAAVHGGTSPGGGIRLAVGGLTVVAVIGLVVAGIWSWAHDFSRPLVEGRTELTVQVDSQTAPRPADVTVELMGRYCARNSITRVTVEEVRPATQDSAVLVVSPVLDEQSQRRYGGCLEDANLNRHRLDVTGTVLVPEERTS